MPHEHRDDLTGEHSIGDAGQIIFALLFLVVWVGDTFFLKYSTSFNNLIPYFVRIPLGLVILIYSGYLARTTTSIVFGEVRDTPQVIRKGIYNIVRHPMYLSEILLYLGLLVISHSLIATAIWVLIILFLIFISRHEEKLLLERFGEDYQKYMQEVPMMLPYFKI